MKSLRGGVRVLSGQPGDYRVISQEGQLVMQPYHITSIPPEWRTNIRRAFLKLLEGDPGARVEVAGQSDDESGGGGTSILLIITATERMQETIAATVAEINAGKLMDFVGTVPANRVFIPKFRKAEAIAAAIRPELTTSGLVHVDEVLNAVTIEDDPAIFNFLVEKIAEVYDQPTPRIVARVHIVEFRDGNDRSVGLNWQAIFDAFPASMSASVGVSRLPLDRSLSVEGMNGGGSISATRLSSPVSSFSAAVEQTNPQVLAGFLNYLEINEICKIVSDVSLNVVNGAPSIVRSAVTASVAATVPSPSGGKERTDITTLEGVELRIEGNLAQLGQRLHVVAQSTSIVGYSLSGVPIISRTDLDTTVGVPTDEAICLSGLSRQKDVEVVHRDPFLGELDLLHLFSKKVKERKEWKIYICITTSLSEVVGTPPLATYKK